MNQGKVAITVSIIIKTIVIIVFLTTIIKNSSKELKNKDNKTINFTEEKKEENI